MGPMRQRYSRPSVETPEGQQRSESWRIEQPLCAHDSERASAIRFSRLGMRWTVNQIVPEAQVPIHQLDFSQVRAAIVKRIPSGATFMRRNQFQKLFLRELRPVSFVELYARSLESSSPERLRLINGQSLTRRPLSRGFFIFFFT